MTLESPVNILNGVGPTLLRRLRLLGIKTVGDLLFYFPSRFEDFSQLRTIAEVVDDEVVTIKVKLELLVNRRSWRRRQMVTEALFGDESGQLKVVWFNQPFLAKTMKPGEQYFLSGRVINDKYGRHMSGPAYEKVIAGKDAVHTGRLVPIYPLTQGITEKQLRYLLSQVRVLFATVPEVLPTEILSQNKLLLRSEAIENMHFPKNATLLEAARRRFQFEEMFVIQLQVQAYRRELSASRAAPIAFLENPTKEFVSALPFTLTNEQRQAAWEALQDMGRGAPMNRLLEGDVGSGKTVVAALLALNAMLNGFQVALMAPTEILAEQHFVSFRKFFERHKFTIGLLTNGHSDLGDTEVSRPDFMKAITHGEVDLLIGTQALIQKKVTFKNLGLIVIDEQHRFGVKQRRELLGRKAEYVPHFMSMTATPIPRSLALALYSDLDLSLIRERPRGRRPIITRLVEEVNRASSYDFLRQEVASGHQVFVVCPLIDESDKLGVKSVTAEYERLQKEVFPDLSIAQLHGKMKSVDKEAIMRDFANKKYQILLSTSVIEVGLDVPNATVMLIEGAERFGLAQLHQLRGRVGRSSEQSYCLLFTESSSEATTERLRRFVACRDGFELAELDLSLRGAGEVFGLRQSGLPDLKLADLSNVAAIKEAQAAANYFLDNKKLDDYPALQELVNKLKLSLHFE